MWRCGAPRMWKPACTSLPLPLHTHTHRILQQPVEEVAKVRNAQNLPANATCAASPILRQRGLQAPVLHAHSVVLLPPACQVNLLRSERGLLGEHFCNHPPLERVEVQGPSLSCTRHVGGSDGCAPRSPREQRNKAYRLSNRQHSWSRATSQPAVGQTPTQVSPP